MDSTVSTIILLIEDNSADIVLFEEALREHGIVCELVVMTDGGEALRYIREVDGDTSAAVPRLVIVDLHLPKHDGEEIIGCLRSSARFASAKVIVTSSSDSERDREKAKSTALYTSESQRH